MRIKKFNDFVDSIDEDFRWAPYRSSGYSQSQEGKSKFSRWMRGVADTLKNDIQYRKGDVYSANYNTLYNVNKAKNTFSLIGMAFSKSAAALADFFTLDDNKDSFSKLPKKEVSKKRDEIMDAWENKNLKGKDVTQKDAEDFYKSGVLKGRNYFGSDYDPMNPRNDDEERYGSYLDDAMERYYNRLQGKHGR